MMSFHGPRLPCASARLLRSQTNPESHCRTTCSADQPREPLQNDLLIGGSAELFVEVCSHRAE
eukprot:765452-Prymnesium_polylepis.1